MFLQNLCLFSATLLAVAIEPNISVMSFSHLCLGFPQLLFALFPCIIVFSKLFSKLLQCLNLRGSGSKMHHTRIININQETGTNESVIRKSNVLTTLHNSNLLQMKIDLQMMLMLLGVHLECLVQQPRKSIDLD